jgi:hypothetical protein
MELVLYTWKNNKQFAQKHVRMQLDTYQQGKSSQQKFQMKLVHLF